jgi:hypothetical protein
MSITTLNVNIDSFLKAKTLNSLTKAIKENIDGVVVNLVGDSCRHIVLVSKDDRYYIEISVDRLSSHSNRVSVFDRVIGADYYNKDQIKGHGFEAFTDYLLKLKMKAWR